MRRIAILVASARLAGFAGTIRTPVTGNGRAIADIRALSGSWPTTRTGVYHGACGTAWSRTVRGLNGVAVRRGVVGDRPRW